MLSSRDKVSPGDPFRPNARLQNELIDAAQRQSLSLAGKRQNPSHHALHLLIQSADNINPGTVVGYSGQAVDVTDAAGSLDEPVMDHAAPEAGRWAIAQDGILKGAAAHCVVRGFAWAEVDVTDAAHKFVDWDGSKLISGTEGPAELIDHSAVGSAQWCLLLLGAGGGSGTVDCATLRGAYSVPDPDTVTTPPLRFVPIHGGDGVCDYIEIVECGMDVPAPCAGCTAAQPNFLLLRIEGVVFHADNNVDPDGGGPAEPIGDPPENSFAHGIGAELLLTRATRCSYTGSLNYLVSGQDITGVKQLITLALTYDPNTTKWTLTWDAPDGELTFTPVDGPRDCMADHVPAIATNTITATGYDFTAIAVSVIVPSIYTP